MQITYLIKDLYLEDIKNSQNSKIRKTGSLVAQWIRICLPMQETRVRSLSWEDPLEKEMAIHSSVLAWKILWTEELGELQSMGLEKSQTQLSD